MVASDGHADDAGPMMHLLIDALSVNNLSGRHVLLGHMQEAMKALPEWRFSLLTHRYNAGIADALPESVERIAAPVGARWAERGWWLQRNGRRICDSHGIDLVFSPSGLLSNGCPRPQVVLAQNPWPLLPGMARGRDRIKAWLQRRAYARAHRQAAVMVFNSNYMRALYEERFGARAGASTVAYQGIDESLFEAGGMRRDPKARRQMLLCVSVMARHKAIETLIRAFAEIAARNPRAELVLAGPWPDASYRSDVDALVREKGLQQRVRFTGHVHQAELERLYTEARVFCLLSRCESFGIPAVEAQAFATPTVVAAGTAAGEVTCGAVVAQDDPAAAADALAELLEDDVAWRQASDAALRNAQRFHWPDCSAPLVQALRGMRAAAP